MGLAYGIENFYDAVSPSFDLLDCLLCIMNI